MTEIEIETAQDYLTVIGEERTYQIVNIRELLKKHPPSDVMAFLLQLESEYMKKLRKLICENKTSSSINDLVARCFRIKMAISTIKNQTEVKDAA